MSISIAPIRAKHQASSQSIYMKFDYQNPIYPCELMYFNLSYNQHRYC